MLRKIITGFHAVEERVLKAKQNKSDSQKIEIFYSKIGPRVKKIISIAKESEIPCTLVSELELNQMVKDLPLQSQDHRGIVLSLLTKESESSINLVDFNQWILENSSEKSKKTVVILDSITDPHNAGAIIRSCDQFAVDLVIFPERRGVKDIEQNEVIARTSAGSVAWVPISIVSNLVRTVQILKENVKIHDRIEISYNRIFAEGEILNMDFSEYFGKPGFKMLVSLDESRLGATVEIDIFEVADDIIEFTHYPKNGEEVDVTVS